MDGGKLRLTCFGMWPSEYVRTIDKMADLDFLFHFQASETHTGLYRVHFPGPMKVLCS